MFKTSTTKGRSFTLGAVLLLGTLAMPSSRTLAKPADFMLDPAHTYITFFVSHVGYADTAGMFLESSGSLRYDEETQQLLNAEISVNTASVFTNHEERDKHLRSADFLNSSEFPKMTFVATKAERLSQTEGRITGDLTLLGVTKPITLEMTLNKSGSYPFGDGHYAIGIDATGEFKRSEFGMTYGVDSNIVGDEIKLVIGLEAIRQQLAFLKHTAEQGLVDAQVLYARMLADGIGVELDTIGALKWFAIAEVLGWINLESTTVGLTAQLTPSQIEAVRRQAKVQVDTVLIDDAKPIGPILAWCDQFGKGDDACRRVAIWEDRACLPLDLTVTPIEGFRKSEVYGLCRAAVRDGQSHCQSISLSDQS